MNKAAFAFLALASLTGLAVPSSAEARICDYRPSELVRSGAAGARDAAAALTSRAVGAFTLTNAAKGVSMLGAQAGTLGQIGGTVGNAAASTTAASGAAVAAVGLGAFEGLCYFRDERISDYNEVLEIMQAIAATADPAYFRVEERAPKRQAAVVVMENGTGETTKYPVRKLYIVNGVLMHREWGLNTPLGDVGFVTVAGARK